MFFCKLEHDQKTFLYFKKYIEELTLKDSVKIDNEIQAKEIEKHCQNNHIPLDNCEEITKWIDSNAEGFRNYLNSIKLIYTVWHCMGHDWEVITWEEFCQIEDKINEIKTQVLDKIR